MPLESPASFTSLLRVLTEHQVEFIVVGGVAAVLNGAPITTMDLEPVEVDLDGVRVRELNLSALIRLKEELGRDKDLAVLAILRRVLEESAE